MRALLEVTDLTVTYSPRDSAAVRAVDNVSFYVEEGEFVGLLGESGCGKSTLGNAVLRLLEKPAAITGGTVRFDGRDITTLDEDELRPHALGRPVHGLPVEHELAQPGDHGARASSRDTFDAHPEAVDGEARPRPARRRPAGDGLAVDATCCAATRTSCPAA